MTRETQRPPAAAPAGERTSVGTDRRRAPRIGSHSDRTTSIELDDTTASLVAELRDLREQNKAITAREGQVRAAILERLDGVDRGTVDGHVIVTVDRATQRRIDTRKLRQEFPDVADWCLRDVEVSTVRIP